MDNDSIPDRILARLEEFAESLEKGENIPETFACRKVVLDDDQTKPTDSN